MSEKTARTYQNVSNRAKSREATDQKVVYKSVLDNPFQIEWPRVPVNVQSALLARVLAMLEGMSDFHQARRLESRKAKKQKKVSKNGNGGDSKFAPVAPIVSIQVDADDHIADMPSECALPTLTEPDIAQEQEEHMDNELSAPSIHQYLTIGINEVSKKLESLSKSHREIMTGTISGQEHTDHAQLVLVCRADIDPPILISHLPSFVAACNSTRSNSGPAPSQPISWLIPLPPGAEAALAGALGLRRLSVIAMDCTMPRFPELAQFLESVPVLCAPWLAPFGNTEAQKLAVTHIKQLRTTAPKNMKAAKDMRAQCRAAAKERRKATPGKVKKSKLVTRKKRSTITRPVGLFPGW